MKKIEKKHPWDIINDVVNGNIKILAKPKYPWGKTYIVYHFYVDPSGCFVTHERGIEQSDVMDTDYFELT